MHSTLLMMLLMALMIKRLTEMMIPNDDYEDPDRLRGGFDGEQAFRGDLTLFNVWDSLLSDAVISRLGRFFDQHHHDHHDQTIS